MDLFGSLCHPTLIYSADNTLLSAEDEHPHFITTLMDFRLSEIWIAQDHGRSSDPAQRFQLAQFIRQTPCEVTKFIQCDNDRTQGHIPDFLALGRLAEGHICQIVIGSAVSTVRPINLMSPLVRRLPPVVSCVFEVSRALVSRTRRMTWHGRSTPVAPSATSVAPILSGIQEEL